MNWKLVFKPKMVIATIVLVTCAGSLQAILDGLGIVTRKKPIALANELHRIGEQVGPYVKDRPDEVRLPGDQEEALGTTIYLTRFYHDTRLTPGDPGYLIRLHIPYYTGTADTVPHVPDRCFTAGGAEEESRDITTVALDQPMISEAEDGVVTATTSRGRTVRLPSRDVPLTVLTFRSPEHRDAVFGVTYFFVANDKYFSRPEYVRLQAFDLTDVYAYYCKVEVMPLGVSDADQTRQAAQEFLSYIMPEVMWCLPDWQKVKAGEYPLSE